MNKFCLSKRLTVIAATFVSVLISAAPAISEEETLECTLYIAESMDAAVMHQVSVDSAAESLVTLRRAGYCVFADGSVADKQFVMVNRVVDGGQRGTNQGYSVYTLDNGDTISVEFDGGWNKGPYSGVYKILGGTGAYADAKGDGTISGTDSPWKTSSVVKIVLNIETP